VKPTFGNLRLVRSSIRWELCCLFLFLLVGFVRASDLPAPFTLDLPVPANKALPTWLGTPVTPATTFATLDLPILTPDTSASLLVTVYFQEKQDGFMRISWQGTQGAQVLSDNFYEDIGMANQRSLLISPNTLVGDGTLTFQCGDSILGIQRIKLEWLENKNGLVSPQVEDLLVTPATGPTQLAQDLNGQSNSTAPGAWQGEIVTVPLTDQAVRIEQGVEFSVDLDKAPNVARIALKETGLPLGQHLVVWINDKRAGTITPAVPDLLDSGFITADNAPTNYFGWRDASFYVPVSLLTAGVNTVQFSDENDTDLTLSGTADSSTNAASTATSLDQPVAIKALVMQLNYVTAPSTTDPVQSPVSTTPTGPITPTDSSSTLPETNTP
jgi:hypothetical protein